MSYPVLISQSNFQAITAVELRDYLRGDDAETDATLDSYIQMATDYLEQASRSSLIRKRYQVTFNNIHCIKVKLPLGPVSDLITVLADGVLQDLNLYSVHNDIMTVPYHSQKLVVTYDVGFESVATLPPAYRLAILACASDLFIHRFDGGEARPNKNQIIQYYISLLMNYSV